MDSENVTSLGENLFQAVAFFSMPLVQTFAIAVLAATLAAFLFIGLREKAQTARNEEPATLTGLRVLAVLLAPIWLLIVGYILRSLGAMAMDFDATLNNTKDGTELRWHVLGFVGLITALGALVSAPLALIRVWTTERQTRTSEQGHMTDRISKAVEQLGAEKMVKNAEGERTVPNIEVRIGGLLSLERIAQDSTRYDKGRDHVRVMEILCAYVRENAPASGAVDFPFPQGCKQETLEEKRKSTPGWLSNELTARVDIQTALSVIGRRTSNQIKIEKSYPTRGEAGYQLDLSRTNLRNANFEFLNFANANFFRSQMQGIFAKGAVFSGANFTYCELTGASAPRANFSNARLEIADLSHANMQESDLRDCKISHTHFVRTQLTGAKIRFRQNSGNSEVNRAFFIDSDFKGTLLQGDMNGIIVKLRTLPEEMIPRGVFAIGFQDCRIGMLRQMFDSIHLETIESYAWLEVTFGDASVTLAGNSAKPEHWPTWELPSGGKHSFLDEWREWQSDPDNYTPPPPPE